MSLDAKKTGTFSRRAFVVAVLKLAAFVIIFGRLFYLQVFAHRKYLDKSTNNFTKKFIIPARRGLVLDCNGEKIAYNSKYWRVIHKGRKKDFEIVAKTLEILKVPVENQEFILKQYKKTHFEEFVIYEFLTQKQLTDIELSLSDLPGIYSMEGVARYYKNPTAYSNIIGYVRTPTMDDLNSGISKHPDIKIGATGLERYFNTEITGEYGYRTIETNAFGHNIRELATVEPKDGKDIKLSIDSRIQEFMGELALDNTMSSTVIDVTTGGILGIVSSPTFNAEKLSQKISQEEWNTIIKDPRNPMFNRAYQAQYAPGSTFKIIVAMAALERGFDPSKTFHCNGSHKAGSHTFRCWKPNGHGRINFHDAIRMSCNVYFYNLADYINSNDIQEAGTELGLNQVHKGLPFYSQAKGLIPDEKWAHKIKKGWYKGDLINTIIGQGSVTCTTLQLSTMIARIASGKKVVPTMQAVHNNFDTLNLSEEGLGVLRNGLWNASNTPGGTSYSGRIAEAGFEFAGKTGTAQVVSKYVKLGTAYKVLEEKPHGLFVGFAPFHAPKFAIATIYQNGGYGASCALPFSRKVLYYAQKLYTANEGIAEKFREDQKPKPIKPVVQEVEEEVVEDTIETEE